MTLVRFLIALLAAALLFAVPAGAVVPMQVPDSPEEVVDRVLDEAVDGLVGEPTTNDEESLDEDDAGLEDELELLDEELDLVEALETGLVDTGELSVPSAATVRRELRLINATGARARAAAKAKRAAKGRLLGSVTKKVGKRGSTVWLRVKLNRTGMRILRAEDRVTLGVRTVVRRKGRTPTVSTASVTMS